MKKNTFDLKTLLIALLFLVGIILLVSFFVSRGENSENQEVTTETCVADECLEVDDLEYPVAELKEPYVEALEKAIDDEYKARSTYDAVIVRFGQVRPFSMIVRAEESHIASLKALFDKYGLEIPRNPYSNVKVEKTVQENCQVGVDAEIANVNLYKNDLLPTVQDYPDIVSVFTNLMNASNDRHLPAFQRCV